MSDITPPPPLPEAQQLFKHINREEIKTEEFDNPAELLAAVEQEFQGLFRMTNAEKTTKETLRSITDLVEDMTPENKQLFFSEFLPDIYRNLVDTNQEIENIRSEVVGTGEAISEMARGFNEYLAEYVDYAGDIMGPGEKWNDLIARPVTETMRNIKYGVKETWNIIVNQLGPEYKQIAEQSADWTIILPWKWKLQDFAGMPSDLRTIGRGISMLAVDTVKKDIQLALGALDDDTLDAIAVATAGFLERIGVGEEKTRQYAQVIKDSNK